VICTVMERPVPLDHGRFAQLQVSGNSSCWYAVSVHKTLPPAGANNLVDSCLLSLCPL
jgi:hypothetical protein